MTRRRVDMVTVKGQRISPRVTLRWPNLNRTKYGWARFCPSAGRRSAEIIVLRGPQGSGKTTWARALALAATARGESAVVFEGDDDLRGLGAVAKRVDLVVICHQYQATMPKLPRGLRVAFVLTCQVGA